MHKIGFCSNQRTNLEESGKKTKQNLRDLVGILYLYANNL